MGDGVAERLCVEEGVEEGDRTVMVGAEVEEGRSGVALTKEFAVAVPPPPPPPPPAKFGVDEKGTENDTVEVPPPSLIGVGEEGAEKDGVAVREGVGKVLML